MLSSSLSGYFTSTGAASKRQAATQAVTEEALLLSTIDSTPLAELSFDELHEFAAAIISAPSPVPTATEAAALPAIASAPAVPTLPSCKNCTYGWETGLGGVWIHGESSSRDELGFRAFVCLEAKPFIIPTVLGSLPATDADSLHHAVFLQRTEGPNEMFGVWTDNEVTDEGRGSDGQIRFRYSRKTLRIKLDEYLALLGFVKEERNNFETRMLSSVRQLGDKDQPVSLEPLVAYCGYGASTFWCDIGSWLSLHVRLESSLNVGTARIQIRLAIYTATPPGGQQIRYLDIPYRALVDMAFENNSFLADLHEKWYNSASMELLGFGWGGGGGRHKRMKTSDGSPAKWTDVGTNAQGCPVT